ncbi:hypothetical protein A2U01_0051396, partial [Trifolium medium]|nr:hypothetical protein [Trifolium medium]
CCIIDQQCINSALINNYADLQFCNVDQQCINSATTISPIYSSALNCLHRSTEFKYVTMYGPVGTSGVCAGEHLSG